MSNLPLRRLLDEVLGPLVTADRGELYSQTPDPATLHLHLRGQFSGCPGNTLVVRRVIEPILHASVPHVKLTVTSGDLVPAGAERWTPSEAAQD